MYFIITHGDVPGIILYGVMHYIQVLLMGFRSYILLALGPIGGCVFWIPCVEVIPFILRMWRPFRMPCSCVHLAFQGRSSPF